MSIEPATVPDRRPIGLVRAAFPFAVVGLAIVILVAIHSWKNTDIDTSKLSMAKMITVLFASALLLLWALRMPGWRKRYVWLGFLIAVGLTFVFVRYDGMKGNFLPTFVARNWVQDTFFGGSPDTILEKHRQAQGKAAGLADLTEKPGDWPAYRGTHRDGVLTGLNLARDWNKKPPKEIWRQPVGAGWAAFSV